jgi:hypothetical protein
MHEITTRYMYHTLERNDCHGVFPEQLPESDVEEKISKLAHKYELDHFNDLLNLGGRLQINFKMSYEDVRDKIFKEVVGDKTTVDLDTCLNLLAWAGLQGIAAMARCADRNVGEELVWMIRDYVAKMLEEQIFIDWMVEHELNWVKLSNFFSSNIVILKVFR